MTESIIGYLANLSKTLDMHQFSVKLAQLLQEPKVYLVQAVVAQVPIDIVIELVGKTVDIQSVGGVGLSQAAIEMRLN